MSVEVSEATIAGATAEENERFDQHVREYKSQRGWRRSFIGRRFRCTGARLDPGLDEICNQPPGGLYSNWEPVGKPLCYIGPLRVPFWLVRLFHWFRLLSECVLSTRYDLPSEVSHER